MKIKSLILLSFKIILIFLIGYTISHFLREWINEVCYSLRVANEVRIILSRFSVIAYIVPFLMINVRSIFSAEVLRVGNFRASISFPLIWRGKEDPVWRFLGIFAVVMVIGTSYFIYSYASGLNHNEFRLLLYYGLIFSLVNSILEEWVWRGVALSQYIKWSGSVYGLIVTSLLFGMSHYDLGFSIWVCIAFSIGGFFMGGVAIRSKGIIASILMHIYMNIIFTMTGMIFS
ncbi:CAAX amino terminal protease family protein [Paenibacillus illinoisensis]|uniref:CAAX amino terminal protease family protein n=2 Tax=Paenibacillus TaxID=44249 RepID=A0A2W0C2F0_9BACL|nr:CAAX amino terminal protease family protein [Paenibacillus illinoisensis]